ncbi:MAG: hypothetical protein MUO91_02460 [candidate division Zixibacteria bacterium]|nr:hypothetical protein [candidate division Zixibacteria bacterium]
MEEKLVGCHRDRIFHPDSDPFFRARIGSIVFDGYVNCVTINFSDKIGGIAIGRSIETEQQKNAGYAQDNNFAPHTYTSFYSRNPAKTGIV